MRARKLPLLLLAFALAAVAALAGTTSSVHAAAVAPYLEAPMERLTVGTWGHSAFPGMAKLHDGSLRLVFREGSYHEAHHDGRIIIAESHDLGETWQNAQVIREGVYDWRDPFVSNPDGSLRLTFFCATASNPALGASVVKEWGYDRRIDQLANAAISGPVVRLPDGRLATAFYARTSSEPVKLYSAYWAWSSDGGWTWGYNRIANLLGAGMGTPEPYMVVSGNWVHVLFRWGVADGIGIQSSPDGGRTWSGQRRILDGYGRPTTIATSNGTLVLVYRDLPSKNAVMAYSTDNGANWVKAGTVLPAPPGSPLGMTYATMVETSPGRIRVVVGMEQADGSSDLWGGEVVVP